jgi:protein-tyrosine-phosphatase
MKKKFWVLFVCSGNTCRSPLAEVILKDRVKKAGLKGMRVSSAGTGALAGWPASEGAKKVARAKGLSLAGFRSKPLSDIRVARADLILTMTPAHVERIGARWPEALAKTCVISDYTGSTRREIRDPIGGPESSYRDCAEDLEDEISKLLPKLMAASKARETLDT